MAEALAAIGLASAIVQFIDFGSKIVTRLADFAADVDEIPKTFRQIKAQLPLIIDTLRETHVQADAHQVNEATANALKPVIDECASIVEELDDILTRALPREKDSNWRRRVKAFSSLAQDKRVAQLQASLERHIPILTYYQTVGNAKTSRQLPIRSTLEEQKSASSPAHQRPCFMVRFEQDANFIGREAELEEIDSRLKQQHRVVLAGIGGVGKSQIAIEYCHRFRNKHPDTHVLWVHGGSRARFEESYQQIATELALPGRNDPFRQPLKMVRDWLNEATDTPWLLVLDNLDTMDMVFGPRPQACNEGLDNASEALVSCLPRTSVGLMVITTRDRRLGERLVPGKRPISVDPFEIEDAQCLLRKKLERDGTVDEVRSRELLRALDCLPLAITQATAFLAENEISVTQYLDILQSDDAEMKAFLSTDLYDPGRDSDLSNSILQTWKVSFDQIRAQNPRAAEILSLMAVLDRQAVFESLIFREKESRIDFVAAVGVLKAFSLVKTDSGSRTFSMHRLVQLATQKWLELEGTIDEWQEIALRTVYECMPDGHIWDCWRDFEPMSPHISRVIASDTGKVHKRTAKHLLRRVWILNNQADYDSLSGRVEAAQRWRTEALDLDKQLHEPDSVEVIYGMARVSDGLQPVAAGAMLREALNRCRSKAESQEYESVTRDCSARLAMILLNEGRAVEAEHIYRKLCEKCPPYINDCDFWGFVYGSRLLDALRLQGRHRIDEAETLHQQMMSELENSDWRRFPHVLQSLITHARYLEYTEKDDEAKALFLRALEEHRESFGETHYLYTWASGQYWEMLDRIKANRAKSIGSQCSPGEGVEKAWSAESNGDESQLLWTYGKAKTTLTANQDTDRHLV